MEDTWQLFEMNRSLADRVTKLELELSNEIRNRQLLQERFEDTRRLLKASVQRHEQALELILQIFEKTHAETA